MAKTFNLLLVIVGKIEKPGFGKITIVLLLAGEEAVPEDLQCKNL